MRADYREPAKTGEIVITLSHDEATQLKSVAGNISKLTRAVAPPDSQMSVIESVYNVLCVSIPNGHGSIRLAGEQKFADEIKAPSKRAHARASVDVEKAKQLYIDGFSATEIGKTMGVSDSTIYNRLNQDGFSFAPGGAGRKRIIRKRSEPDASGSSASDRSASERKDP